MDFAYMDVLMGNLQCFVCFFGYMMLLNTYLATLFTEQFVDLSVKN